MKQAEAQGRAAGEGTPPKTIIKPCAKPPSMGTPSHPDI